MYLHIHVNVEPGTYIYVPGGTKDFIYNPNTTGEYYDTCVYHI